MKSLVLFLLLLSSLFAFDLEMMDLSSYKIANGKTVLITFQMQKGIELESAKVGKKEFQIFDTPNNPKQKYLLLPFSYYAAKGNKEVFIKYKEGAKQKQEKILLKVIDGHYAKEEIHVSSAKVNPRSEEVKERIAKEYREAMKIYRTITPKSYITKEFIFPLESKITSDFGKARVYNGSLKGYHSGTDYRAKVGTPIKAANDGRVALVKNRFYSGGTVLLDHGEGIYTCYFHMSAFRVKEGAMVKRGEILGLSGKSGRVTGPHLHFSARINAVQVDPLQLIEIMNKKLLRGK